MNRMNKWKISLYLAALFLAGAVTGALVTVKLGARLFSQEKIVARWRGELEGRLQLTPDQVRQITPLLQEAMTEFRSDFTEQMLVSVSNCNARIATVLTPEQKAKFAEFERQQIEFVRGGFSKDKHPRQP